MEWRATLQGAGAQLALQAALDLAGALKAHPARAGGDQPLGEALAERALFFAALDAALPRREHRLQAEALLDQALDAAAAETLQPALFGGFLGVAFIAQHLQRLWGEPADLDDVDQALLAHLDAPGPPPPHE